jgi:hypothetical protein
MFARGRGWRKEATLRRSNGSARPDAGSPFNATRAFRDTHTKILPGKMIVSCWAAFCDALG